MVGGSLRVLLFPLPQAGFHYIAEIVLNVALNTKIKINVSCIVVNHIFK